MTKINANLISEPWYYQSKGYFGYDKGRKFCLYSQEISFALYIRLREEMNGRPKQDVNARFTLFAHRNLERQIDYLKSFKWEELPLFEKPSCLEISLSDKEIWKLTTAPFEEVYDIIQRYQKISKSK